MSGNPEERRDRVLDFSIAENLQTYDKSRSEIHLAPLKLHKTAKLSNQSPTKIASATTSNDDEPYTFPNDEGIWCNNAVSRDL